MGLGLKGDMDDDDAHPHQAAVTLHVEHLVELGERLGGGVGGSQ